MLGQYIFFYGVPKKMQKMALFGAIVFCQKYHLDRLVVFLLGLRKVNRFIFYGQLLKQKVF